MKKIFIYQDEGCDPKGIELLIASLRRYNLDIELVDSRLLSEENWENQCDLLIIGGGRDQPYHNKLSGDATAKIRQFVYNGGSYFGICAGAYFGAATIAFDAGGPLEIIAERELAFFPGCASGPILGEYSYFDGRGKRAALMDIGCHLYYNGGCTFEGFPYHQSEIIARYSEIERAPPAIIEIGYGSGIVLLSGCHIEVSGWDLDSTDPFECGLIEPLLQSERARCELFRNFLSRLLRSCPQNTIC